MLSANPARRLAGTALAIAFTLVLAACGADQRSADVTPTAASLLMPTVPAQELPTAGTGGESTAGTQGEPTMTTTGPTGTAGYPRTGHAPDYTWVAGRVTFTRIQSGCIYLFIDPAEIAAIESPGPTSTPGISGPFVGTAERSDTSPPLTEITPQVGPMPTQPPGTQFVPGGPGWNPQQYKDGDYVVMFGRLAGPGDPLEMCPGGTHYVVDSVVLNQ